MKTRDFTQWTQVEAAHLLNRAGFGGTPEAVRQLHALGPEAAVDSLLAGGKPASEPPPKWANAEAFGEKMQELKILKRQLVGGKFAQNKRATESMEENDAMMEKSMDGAGSESARAEARMDLQRKYRRIAKDQGVELTHWWFRRMLTGEFPLQEKMTLFWHGHFATSMEKVREPYFMFLQNVLFRKHALGDFAALLKGIVRDPAMMIYLDVAQSRKQMPNENFAREVMELFTLGEGNYTEADIKSAAQAFTGLRLSKDSGEVRFTSQQHAAGEKKMFGQSGDFGPEETVDLLLKQEACARFLARKLLRQFVNDAPTDAEIAEFATVLRAENYHMGASLRRLFLSQDFYARKNIRAEIKSPVEFLVQLAKQLELSEMPEFLVIGAMRELGQQLFLPPNVAGWPGGSAWITTNTLFTRYNIAGLLTRSMDPDYSVPRIAGNTYKKNKRRDKGKRSQPGMAAPDYARLVPESLRQDAEKLLDDLVFRFFQFPLRPEDRETFLAHARKESDGGVSDIEIARLVHLMTSTPFYQLT